MGKNIEIEKEEISVKDYRGNYRKLKISGNKIYLGKAEFDFTLKRLVAMVNLYDLRITRKYKKRLDNSITK